MMAPATTKKTELPETKASASPRSPSARLKRLEERLKKEVKVSETNPPTKRNFLSKLPLRAALPILLGMTGLKGRASREFRCLLNRSVVWHLPSLPAAFEGLRILHLSDLHLDVSPELPARLAESLKSARADLCVMTGDFQDKLKEPPAETRKRMRPIVDALDCPIYGVPGNHDSIGTIDALETLRIKFLINESVRIERKGACIHICGIDDPHFYQTEDLERVAGSGFRILLSHSPETYNEAAALGFAMCLCGHTHGGQIKLPFLGPIFKGGAKVPRRMVHGKWDHKKLKGYTSSGIGGSVFAYRLNCPPEIITHILHRDG